MSFSRFFTGSAASSASLRLTTGLTPFVGSAAGGEVIASRPRLLCPTLCPTLCPLAPTSALAGVAAGTPPATFHPGSPTPFPVRKSEQHSTHRSTSHAQHDRCKFATAPPHMSQNSRHPLAPDASMASSCESLVAAHSASAAISFVSRSAVALSVGAHVTNSVSHRSSRRDSDMTVAKDGDGTGSRRHARHVHVPTHLGHRACISSRVYCG